MRRKVIDIRVAKQPPGSWRSALLLLILAAGPLGGQTAGLSGERTNPLPATTGEPLTIVPMDLKDIDCSIQEWNSDVPRPFVTLLCPGKAEFAPIRVYLKLSWLKLDDVPANVGRIIAGRAATKIRTTRSEVLVLLDVAGEKGKDPKSVWVGFNGVVDLALIKDSRHQILNRER